MSSPAAVLLMETPRLRMIRNARPSAMLIVTFSNYAEEGVEAEPFGQNFFAAYDIDAIHLIARGNHWFELPEMEEAIASVQRLDNGRPIYAYGSSMGGYAALRFGGAIGAMRAIAISPQYRLGRRAMRGEHRWLREARSVRLSPELAASTVRPSIIFYDPRNIDAVHAALWRAQLAVEMVPLPFAGHPATAFLAQVGLLGPTIRGIVGGGWDRVAVTKAARERRGRSGQYLAQLAMAQPGHRRRCALLLAGKAVDMAPSAPDYIGLHATLLYRAGRMDEAEQRHRAARQIRCDDPMAAFRLSRFLQRVGRYAEALEEAEAAAGLAPENRTLARHRARVAASGRPGGWLLRLISRLRHWHNQAGWRRGWRLADRLARP